MPNEPLRSGSFVLDLECMRLTKSGTPISLSGQPLQILSVLLAASGRLVMRFELKQALWPGSARIDTDRRLNTAMRALREVLGDTADAPQFIQTVRGRGYRWIGEERCPAPGTRLRPHLAAAAAFVMALMGAAGSAHHAPGEAAPTPQQRERFMQIAATADNAPLAASSALDALIAERPRYAAAQLLRAELAVQLWRESPGADHRAGARAALRSAQAVVHDDADIEALAAELSLAGDWDWVGAEREYRRAIAMDPNHVSARKGLAWLLLNAGREHEAFAELEPLLIRADLTDPLRAEIGWLLLRMQRADLALDLCNSRGSEHLNLLACRHTALSRLGEFGAARDAALVLMQRVSANEDAIAAVRRGTPQGGYARFLAWRAHGFLPSDSPPFQQAQVQAEAGHLDAALASLDRAYSARDPGMVKLWTTREFAPLRANPRFMALWRAVGPRAS